ncbi:MAG: prolipoprotein diacylglyceryl transferase [Negativibacillus sp.]|nr:prolipoprotein diacylglyceryl transferase [Negativibacillus sp.]
MEQTANIVSFPGLGWEFEIDRVAFHIGSLPVYWYGILIALGFILAILYVTKRAKEFGVDPDRMLDVVLGGAIGGIVGARAYFVLLRWDYYGQNLDQIFNTRSGGMAIYGGLIGGLLVGLLMCKLRKVKAKPALDLVVGGFFIGQCIGRWGNFINVEAFGGNTGLPWGMSSPAIVSYLTQHEAELEAIGMNIDPNMPVHPTFLYESLWCLLGFVLIAWYTKRRRFDGELTLLYTAWYGAGRAVIEGLRTDSLMIPGTSLRASQVLALVLVIAAVILWVVKSVQLKKSGKTQLYVDTEEGQLVVSGQFYQKKGAQAEQPAAAEENFSGNSEQAEVLSEQAENAEESQQTQAAEVLAEEPADSEDEQQ